MAGWFQRRVVRAELTDFDVMASMGAVRRFADFRGADARGRVFWASTVVVQLLLFAGLVVLLLAVPFEHRAEGESLDRGRLVVTGTVALGCLWMCVLQVSTLRAMAREWSDPRRADDEE